MGQEDIRRNWVWVVIQEGPTEDTLLGREDEQTGERFIPFFASKEEGESCMPVFRRGSEAKYAVEAMLYEELVKYAGENGFTLFKLDSGGRVLEKIRRTH